MNRRILTIDGRDGSGKSRLAREVLAAAGTDAIGVAVDDYRRPVAWDGDQAEIYYSNYFDLAAIDRLLAAYLAGRDTAEVPAGHPLSGEPGSRRTVRLDKPLLVVEGVFIGRLEAARRATRVYVRASEAAVRARVEARDVLKGRTPADVASRIDNRYVPAQRRYHAGFDPLAEAHVIVDHETLGAPTVVAGPRFRDAPEDLVELVGRAVTHAK